MINVKDLINSKDIIKMIYKASGKRWSLTYFSLKKNYKGFPDPAFQSGRIYLWSRDDIVKYIELNVKKKS